MSKEYGHIKQFENEILEMKSKGLTQREIADKLGFSKYQIKEFFHRYNKNQRKLSLGTHINPKGTPRKERTSHAPSLHK